MEVFVTFDRSPPRAQAILLAVWAMTACSPRTLPDRFPTASSVSAEAPEPPPPPAAVALREDPPLPGETSSGWLGLAAGQDGSTDPHAHHHGMMHGTPAPRPDDVREPDAGAPAPAPHGGHSHGP